MGAETDSTKRRDAIKYSYEALEAAAKAVCENRRDLSANRELLVKRLGVTAVSASVLDEYIKLGNLYRHGQVPPAPEPTYASAEQFLYLTGILLRTTAVVLGGAAAGR